MNGDIFGHLGGCIIAFALVPQVWKSWKTKSTEDISFLWNSMMLIGLSLFLIYGIGIWSLPIMIFTTIEVLLTVSLLVLKWLYQKR